MSHTRAHHAHGVRRQVQEAWPALGMWQIQVTQGNVRVGDAERDQAARALGEHFAAGRLDPGEYDERIDTVLAARTRGELVKVFGDLPGGPGTEPRPTPAVRRRPRARLPFLPLLLIVVGLAILLDATWVFWVGLGAILLARHATRHTHHTSRTGRTAHP